MPLGLLFSDDDARLVGAYVGSALLPILLNQYDRLNWIHADVHGLPDAMRSIGGDIVDAVHEIPLRVFGLTSEMHPQLPEDLSETRWGIARLDYSTRAEVQLTLWGMHRTVRRTNQLLEIVDTHMIDVTCDLSQIQWRIL